MFTRTATDHGYWRDHRDPAKNVQDTDSFGDNPLSRGPYHLAKGYELLSRWSGGAWKHGDLLGIGGADDAAKKKTATYAAPRDWHKIQDPRVATSTGHIMKRGRPRAVAPGWGGYDEFTAWQASGRHVQPWMPERPVQVVTDVAVSIPFVDDEGQDGPRVGNVVPPAYLPQQKNPPMSLYAVMHQRRQVNQRKWLQSREQDWL